MFRSNLITKPTQLLLTLLLASPVFAADNAPKIEQANSIYTSGDYSGALEAAKKIISSAPKNADGYTISGLSSLALGDFQSAEASLQKALSLAPKSQDAHNNLALLYCKTNKEAKALELFDLAIKLDSANSERAAVNAAICANRMGDELRAENYLQIALKAKNQYAPAFYEMSHLQYRNGRFDLASQYLSQYHQFVKPNRESLMLAALISKADGNKDLQHRYESQLASLEKGLPLSEVAGGAKLSADASKQTKEIAVSAQKIAAKSIADLKAEQADLNREEKQKSEIDARISDAQQSRVALDDQIKKITAARQELENKISKENLLRDNLFTQIDASRNERGNLDKKVSRAAKERAQAEPLVDAQRQELDKLTGKLYQASQDKSSLDRELAEISKQKEYSAQLLANFKDEAVKITGVKTAQLAQIAEVQSQIDAEKTLISQSTKGNSAQNLETEQARDQLGKLTQERMNIQSTLSATRQARITANASLEVTKTENTKLTTELRDAQNSSAALEQQFSHLRYENSNLLASIEQAQNTSSSTSDKTEKAQKTVIQSKADLDAINGDLSTKKNLLAQIQDEEGSIRNQIMATKIGLEKTKKEIAASKSLTKSLSDETKQLAISLLTAQTQLDTANRQRIAAAKELDEVRINNIELTKAIAEAKKQMSDTAFLTQQASNELGAAKTSDTELRAKLATLNDQFKKAQASYEIAKSSKDAMEAQIQDQTNKIALLDSQKLGYVQLRLELLTSIEANKGTLSAKNPETAILAKEVEKIEKDYQLAKHELEQANQTAQASSDKLKSKKDEVAELQKSFEIAGSQINQTQKDLRATESQLVQLNELLNQKVESKKGKIGDSANLKSQIVKANEQTLSVDREIANLIAGQQDAQAELKSAKTSLVQSQQKLQEAKSTSGNLAANLSDVEKENLKANNELASFQTKLKGNNDKRSSIAEDQSRITSLIGSTTKENLKIEEQIKTALALHESVQQNLQILTAQNGVLKASLNETLSSAEQQKQMLKQSADEKQKFDKQLSEKISHLDSLNSSLHNLENQKEKIATATQKASDEAGRVVESIKQIQSQLVSATADKDAKRLVLSGAKNELEAAQNSYKVEDGESKELSAAVSQATKARELTEIKLHQLEREKSRLSKQLNQENSHERQLSAFIANTTQNINSLALTIEKTKLNQQQAQDQILILEKTKATNMAEHNAEAEALSQAKQALMSATQERKAREQELSNEKAQRLSLERQAIENEKEIARADKLDKANPKIEEINYLRQSNMLAHKQALETAKNAEIDRAQSKLLKMQTQIQQQSEEATVARINRNNTQQAKLEPIELMQAPSTTKVSTQKKDRFKASNKTENDTLFDQ